MAAKPSIMDAIPKPRGRNQWPPHVPNTSLFVQEGPDCPSPPQTRSFGSPSQYRLASEEQGVLFFSPDYTTSPHHGLGVTDRTCPSLILRAGTVESLSSLPNTKIQPSLGGRGTSKDVTNKTVFLELCDSCREEGGSRTCTKLHLDVRASPVPSSRPSSSSPSSSSLSSRLRSSSPSYPSLKSCSVVVSKLQIRPGSVPKSRSMAVDENQSDGNETLKSENETSQHGNEPVCEAGTQRVGNEPQIGQYGNEPDQYGNEPDQYRNESNRYGNELDKYGNESDPYDGDDDNVSKGLFAGIHSDAQVSTSENRTQGLESVATADENGSLRTEDQASDTSFLDVMSTNDGTPGTNVRGSIFENKTFDEGQNETHSNGNELLQDDENRPPSSPSLLHPNEVPSSQNPHQSDEDSKLPDFFCCVACLRSIYWQSEMVHVHKMLKVITCLACYNKFHTGEFKVGEDGSEIYCTLCGDGGKLILCDNNCPKAFCQTCITNVCGSGFVEKLESDSEWKCFCCDPSPLAKEAEFCRHVVDTLKSRKTKKRKILRRERKKEQQTKDYKSKEFISSSEDFSSDDDDDDSDIVDVVSDVHAGLTSSGATWNNKLDKRRGDEAQTASIKTQPVESEQDENEPAGSENEFTESVIEHVKNEYGPNQTLSADSANASRGGSPEGSQLDSVFLNEASPNKETMVSLYEDKTEPPGPRDHEDLELPFVFNYTDSVIDRDHTSGGSGKRRRSLSLNKGSGNGRKNSGPVSKKRTPSTGNEGIENGKASTKDADKGSSNADKGSGNADKGSGDVDIEIDKGSGSIDDESHDVDKGSGDIDKGSDNIEEGSDNAGKETKRKYKKRNRSESVEVLSDEIVLSDDDYFLQPFRVSNLKQSPKAEKKPTKPAPTGTSEKKPYKVHPKVGLSDYGLETLRKRIPSSSEEEETGVRSNNSSSLPIVISTDSSSDGESVGGADTPVKSKSVARDSLVSSSSRKQRLVSYKEEERTKIKTEKIEEEEEEEEEGATKRQDKKRAHGSNKNWINTILSSDEDGRDETLVTLTLSTSSSSPSPLHRLVTGTGGCENNHSFSFTLQSDSSSSSDSTVVKRKRRKIVFSDGSSSSAPSRNKMAAGWGDSSDEFESGRESGGYFFKEKRRKRKHLQARLLSSGSDDDIDDDDDKDDVRGKKATPTNKSSDDELTPVTPVKRKNIRKLISKDKLDTKTKEAQKAEKERLDRLKKRSNDVMIIEDDERLILDKDSETNEVLEVRTSLVPHILPHQLKGIKFLYNSVCEDMKRLLTEPGSGAILAHCMGLGKTLQVIAFIDCLLSSESTNINRVLVLCPVNTLLNWNDEWNKWVSISRRDYRVIVVDAKLNQQRSSIIEKWFRGGGVALMGYEMFRNLASGRKIRKTKLVESFKKCLLDPGPDIIVCDEGHVLRREKSNLSLVVSEVATRRRIVLTGTPLQNNLKEYYTMVNFVKPNLLGTMREFCNRFANPISNGQCADSRPIDVRNMKQRAHILFQLLSGCVDRKDYRILAESLPPKYEYVVSIRMTPVQEELIKRYLGKSFHTASDLFSTFASLVKVWNHPWVLMLDQEKKKLKDGLDSLDGFIDDDEEDDDDSVESFVVRDSASDDEYKVRKKKDSSNSREASNGPSTSVKDGPTSPTHSKGSTSGNWFEDLLPEDAEDNIALSGKMEFLLELLEETKKVREKVLVFSQSLLMLDQIEYLIQQRDFVEGIDYFRLDGSTKAIDRTECMRKFNKKNNENIRLFLISTKAGSLGVNLIGANRVVIFDACWNPTHDLQSIFRTYRFGQTKPVFVYRLLAQGTMEEKIYDRQVTKTSLSLRVIDEKQIGRHYTYTQLQELFTFTPAPPPAEDAVYDRPSSDIVFCKILDNLQPKAVVKYHEHDSLLEHVFDEELSEEERKAAWDNYNAAKELDSRAYNIGMSIQQQQQAQQAQQGTPGLEGGVVTGGFVGGASMNDLLRTRAIFGRVSEGLTFSSSIMHTIALRNLLAPKVLDPSMRDIVTIQRYVMACDKLQTQLSHLHILIPEIRDSLSNNSLLASLPLNERRSLDGQRTAFLKRLKEIDEAMQVPAPNHNEYRHFLLPRAISLN